MTLIIKSRWCCALCQSVLSSWSAYLYAFCDFCRHYFNALRFLPKRCFTFNQIQTWTMLLFFWFFAVAGTNPDSIVIKEFRMAVRFSEVDSVFWGGNFLKYKFDFFSFWRLVVFLVVEKFTLFLSFDCILFNYGDDGLQSFGCSDAIMLFLDQIFFVVAFEVIYYCLWILIAHNLIIQIVYEYRWNLAV